MSLITEEQQLEATLLLESALNHLLEAGTNKQYDPSWIRPKTMSPKEIQSACLQAYHELHKAIEIIRPPLHV